MKSHMVAFHKTEFESDSNSAAKDHFIRSEFSKSVNDFNWKCNYCDQSLAYGSLKPHMLKMHKTEVESSSLSVTDHCTRGELREWNCNYCDQSVIHSSLKKHMLTFHANESDDHFIKTVMDYNWNCKRMLIGAF